MAAITVTLVGSPVLETIRPQSGSTIQSFPSDPFVDNAIGERKKITYEFNLSAPITDMNFYFVPGITVQNGYIYPGAGNAPVNAFGFQFVGVPALGVYPLLLQAQSGSTPDVMKNFTCELELVSLTNVKVTLYFYNIYDTDGPLTPIGEDNHFKLLKDRKNNPLQLNLSGASMYTSIKPILWCYLFVQSIPVPADKGFTIQTLTYQAGAYTKGPQATAGYFNAATWVLSRTIPVNDLSVAVDTKVTFDCFAPADVVDEVLIWMIKDNAVSNAVDFLTNYDYSFETITTVPGVTLIHNKLRGPSTGPTSVGANHWKVDFNVNHSKVAIGESYRFIAVVYYNSGSNYEVTSFITQPYRVTGVNTFKGSELTFTGYLDDYNRSFDGNNLKCVVEERIRSRIDIDYPASQYSNDIFNRLGLVIANDIRRYLTFIKMEIYEETTVGPNTTRQIFDRKTMLKLSPTQYQNQSGVTLTLGVDESILEYLFRVRYEGHITNVQTLINGIPTITPTANQNWANRKLIIEWTLNFFYDDYYAPFADVVIYRQKLNPKGYEGPKLSIKYESDIDEDNEFICNTDQTCLRAVLNLGGGENSYRLLTTIEAEPGNVLLNKENEEFASVQMPQLDSPNFTSQEIQFGQTVTKNAKFCINATGFFVNSSYKVVAIAKKWYDCERTTSDGVPRTTSDGVGRITSECSP